MAGIEVCEGVEDDWGWVGCVWYGSVIKTFITLLTKKDLDWFILNFTSTGFYDISI